MARNACTVRRRSDVDSVEQGVNGDLKRGSFRFIGDASTLPDRKFFGLPFYVEHPSARGHLHITSAEDVLAQPDFQPGYLVP